MSRRPLEEQERTFLWQLGRTIREIRREQGLLQEQLGARSGVLGTRIGEIERGKVDTSITRIWAIAGALGLSPAALLRRRELAAQDERAADDARSRITAAVRRLAPQDVDALAQVVAALARKTSA